MDKTLYICGDSFCSTDIEYGPAWHELLANQYPNLKIVNLSIPGASNYLIYLQVKEAIAHKCDYLIYHASSSTRQEFVLNHNDDFGRDSLDRYWNVCAPDSTKTLLCTSWNSITRNTENTFSSKDYSRIKDFFKRYIDLPVMIEKNYIFILHTLQLIESTPNLIWAWSRGGFEHHSFTTVDDWDFSKWAPYECSINLWDHYDPKLARPYYHVTDKKIINEVYKEYGNMLQLSNV